MTSSNDRDLETKIFYSNRLRWIQALMAHKKAPERYKLVGIAIILRVNPPSFQSFPEMETIAGDTNVSKSTVIRATKWLEDHKWIFVSRYGSKEGKAGRKSNRYSMLVSNI
jgi:DNA-binding MarR family transcriptional regulator